MLSHPDFFMRPCASVCGTIHHEWAKSIVLGVLCRGLGYRHVRPPRLRGFPRFFFPNFMRLRFFYSARSLSLVQHNVIARKLQTLRLCHEQCL